MRDGDGCYLGQQLVQYKVENSGFLVSRETDLAVVFRADTWVVPRADSPRGV